MEDVKQLRETLWENGYRPIAVLTGQKRPYGDDYIERALRDPPDATIRPAYGFAASTAILCAGLRALDIDIDDPDLADHIETIAIEIFGETIIRFRADSPRRLLLYRGVKDASKDKIEFEAGYAIEILGCRQKFLAFGQHEDGEQYQWVGGRSPTLVPLAELFEFDEEAIELFKQRCDEISPIIKKNKNPDASRQVPMTFAENYEIAESRGRTYALGAMSSIEAALAAQCTGGRNNLLNDSAFRLGSLGARGWLEISEAQNALRQACESNGLIKADGLHSWLKTFKSGWESGLRKPARDPETRDPIEDRRSLATSGSWDRTKFLRSSTTSKDAVEEKLSGGQNNCLETGNYSTPQNKTVSVDFSLTYAPGVLGRLIDWITDSSPHGNRRLSLSAALALTSMLLGRNLATPTHGSLEMYIISTCPTGGGKGHQPRAINSIVDRLQLEHHMGDDEFKSGAYIEGLIQKRSLSLSIQDEFAQILATWTSPNASKHVAEISTLVRKLFGINFDTLRTGGANSRQSVAVHCPHLSIYGMTTNSQLFRSVKGKDISNGIINRFLLIDGGDERMINPLGEERRPDVKSPPPELLAELFRLYKIGPLMEGNLSGNYNKNVPPKPRITTIPWESVQAKNVYNDFVKECLNIIDKDPDIGEVYARTAFYAVKIATICACCRNPVNPMVSLDDIILGKKISKESSDRFYAHTKEHMVDILSYPEIFRKIEGILSTCNEPGLPANTMQHRKLFDKMKNYCGKTNSDFSNSIRELERSGVLMCHKIDRMHVITLLPKS